MFFSFFWNYVGDHWRYLLRHWFLLVLFAIILSFIVGWFGQGFGVPLLFRDDPAYDYQEFTWSLNRPSISAYTAATVLLAAILAVVYIFEIAGTKPSRSRGRTVRETITFFAIAGAIPLAALLAAATFPSIPIADGAPACVDGQHTYCTTSEIQSPDADGVSLIFHLKEGGKALIGIFIGGVIALLCGLAIFAMSNVFERRRSAGRSKPNWFTALWSSRARDEYPLVFGAIILIVILFALAFIIPALGISLAAMARPGAAICILFGMLVIFYFAIHLLAPALRFIGVVAFLAWHALIGADRYINELPGFKTNDVNAEAGETRKTDYYDCLLPLKPDGEPFSVKDRVPCPEQASEKVASTKADLEGTPELLDVRSWVKNWTPDKDNDAPRKLVVIATQGGAYRATFWTSLVLDELAMKTVNGELPGMIDHVGLLTGASGGMVASAYFAAMSTNNRAWYESYEADDCGMNADGADTWTFGPITSQICRDVYNASDASNTSSKFTMPKAIARDSLTPVAAQTVLYDMGRVLLWPLTTIPGLRALDWDGLNYLDRGLVLERQWGTLHQSYGELAKKQQALMERGERFPSMIVSPMIADTGQPMLISNLDLENLVDNGSNEAISMFDWFPDVRDNFRVQTAIRMNATFPYISPAVSLPTTVRRRVVDAGYYDNYGVNTAISWLFQEDVIDFLAESDLENLVIIQVRAFQSKDFGQQALNAEKVIAMAKTDTEQRQRTRSITGGSEDEVNDEAKRQRQKEKHSADLPLIPEWLTSPLTGVLTARDGSMAYRNNAQIDRLKKVLEARGRSSNFVLSFAFENHAETDQVGVSWHITPQEMATLEQQLKEPHNEKQFKALNLFWNRSSSKIDNDKIASE